MCVRWNLRLEQGDKLRSANLPLIIQREARSLPGLDDGGALYPRQRKSGFAITAIHRAQQAEERRILRYGQQLVVTPRPTFGREVERENADFCNKWICHDSVLLFSS